MITQATASLIAIASGQNGVLGIMSLALVVFAIVVVYCFKLFIDTNNKLLQFAKDAAEKSDNAIIEVRKECAEQIENFVDQLNKCEARCQANSDQFMQVLNRFITSIGK